MGEEVKKKSIMSLGGRSPDTYSVDDREVGHDLDFDEEEEDEEFKSEPAEQEVAVTDSNATPMKFSEDVMSITPPPK